MASTSICTSDLTSITVRGRDLVNELVGELSFTEMLYFLSCGRKPDAGEAKVLDACLVTIMEHGINPSTIVARLIADTVPDEPQVAIAAGLLGVGGVFAGTSEQCAAILQELAKEGEGAVRKTAERLIASGQPIPGFGHLHHKPDDPRTPRLFAVAEKAGVKQTHMRLLRALGKAIDEVKGRHITINATGAIGALMLDIDVPVAAIRCFSVVARSAGLTAHLLEEKSNPAARTIWRESRNAVPYVAS
ncbi:MAG TPA: citryl-CoA lyase [Burkholderiales bacterium]|nr:citryl-CoA lyase [Burkholderiales bacterium]